MADGELTDRPLRVAHLTATYPPYRGGAGTVCSNLARGLAARGHRVEVHTAGGPGGPGGSPDVHRHAPVFAIGNAPLIPALARLRGHDVLHLHYPFIFGSELALWARRRSGATALVVSYHNELIGEGGRRPLFWGYEHTAGRLAVRAADRVAIVSAAHAATVPSLRRARADRLVVLPNGVDVDTFSPGPSEVRERVGIPANAPLAAFVATLDRAHYFKRLDLALAALAQVEGVHLLVAGDGEWRDRYAAEADELGIAGRVHFVGALGHDALADALRACDLLLLTSDLESFGIVLIEAMACGLPTVATDLPGVRAVVRDGETGVLARPGDAPAVAAALRTLVEMDPSERRRMGASGRELCEREYAWPRLVQRLETIYADALASRRGRCS